LGVDERQVNGEIVILMIFLCSVVLYLSLGSWAVTDDYVDVLERLQLSAFTVVSGNMPLLGLFSVSYNLMCHICDPSDRNESHVRNFGK